MTDEKTEAKLKRRIRLKRLVKKKCHGFEKSGYHKISEDEFWHYLLDYRWKKKDTSDYHSLLKDIKTVTSNDYFDYEMIKAQTSEVQSFDWQRIEDLID